MKKAWIVLLVLVLLAVGCTPGNTPSSETATPDADATATPAPAATPVPTLEPMKTPATEQVLGDNLIPLISSTFDDAKVLKDTAWTGKYGSVTVSLSDEGYEDTMCLKIEKPTEASASFYTAAINLVPFITEAGTYRVTFRYRVESDDFDSHFKGVVRTDSEYTFAPKKASGQCFSGLDKAPETEGNEWADFETTIVVEQEDVDSVAGRKGAHWNFGLHDIKESVSAIYIDDFEVRRVEAVTPEYTVDAVQTWVAAEMVFHSSKKYTNPLFDAEADMILTKGSESYTIPLFWDGGNVWRVRFVCPAAGEWNWRIVCTDAGNTGLNGRTGVIRCTQYDGPLEVYRRGFVKTDPDKKYFVYGDGTPFFYLGDTHWGLPGEPLEQLEKIFKKRIEQGYSVIQSEPLGAKFNVTDGITSSDLQGFQTYDQYFALIAAYGFVHTNAEFFFPSSMSTLIENFGGYNTEKRMVAQHGSTAMILYDLSDTAKDAMQRFCRYWVARYSAYPVMWTMGQEIDNDYFWQLNDYKGHKEWGYANNPYRYMAAYLNQADPYKHPLTAHQEGSSMTRASSSAFRDVEAHTWYAAQWSGDYSAPVKYDAPKDFWETGQGKPVVMYESKYCYLWTKNFGARVQGWMAFLNGMCGYGWGGQDTWYYLSNYSENETSEGDGVDVITPQDKQNATWQDSLKYPSSNQAGYMRRFFENTVGDWYNLIPRFGDEAYLAGDTNLFMMASNAENSKIVVYFYNFSDSRLAQKPNATEENAVKTGTLKKLAPNTQYSYQWFNAVTGKVDQEGTFTSSADGTWKIPEKSNGDMVLYVFR